MKRRILLAVACILLVAACTETERSAIGASDGDDVSDRDARPTAPPAEPQEPRSTTTEPPDDDAEKDLQVEVGFTTELDLGDTRDTTVGALVTNPNDSFAAYDVTVVFNLLAADGTTIDTESADVPYIPAGATVPVTPSYLGFDILTEPASVDVQIAGSIEDDDGWAGADSSMYQGIDLDVDEAALDETSYSLDLSFNATNPSDTVSEFASWTCVFRHSGEIVGGDSSGILDPIVPGGTVRVDSYVQVETVTVDEIICRAFF